MKTKDLNDDISTARLLSTVYNQMLNWDLEPMYDDQMENIKRVNKREKDNLFWGYSNIIYCPKYSKYHIYN